VEQDTCGGHGQDILKKRLQQQEFLSAISQSFVSSDEMGTLINNALMMTGMFMMASRVLVGRLDGKTHRINFEYEWCNFLQNTAKAAPRSFDFVRGDLSYDTYITRGDVFIACADTGTDPGISPRILERGAKAFISAPIFVYNDFWGLLTVDDCQKNRDWDEEDIQILRLVSSALANLVARCQTEEELRRMSSIVNASPYYIAWQSTEGEFKYLNQGAQDITGYSKNELLESGPGILFSEEIYRKIVEHYNKIILDKGLNEVNLPIRRKDGEERMLSFSGFTTDAKKQGFAVIALDITEKLKLERELIAAKEQAEQSNQAKTDFLSRMSHEMRTPLNAIIGMSTIAGNSKDMDRIRYCLSKVNDASVHLLGVINDILDMSKIEAGKFELSCAEFDFERMLRKLSAVMEFKFNEKKQNFVVRIDREVPMRIIGDEQRISQILTNLIANAVKFTPEEGSITLKIKKIATEGLRHTLRFDIIDTGIGISEEQKGRLFNLFEQADGTIARRYGGTGLGLAISKRFVELMEGRIWVESEPGKGSDFIFEIVVKAGKQFHLPRETARWEELRILVADDSPDVLEYFREYADYMKIHCETAGDGDEAVKLMETAGEIPYDIVFADWRMPRMNGIELTREIKSRYGDQVIVILISASEWSTIADDAEKAGVDGFIPKPLFYSSLTDCINNQLSHIKKEIPKPEPDNNENIFAGKTILLAEDVEINREIIYSLLEDTGIQIESAENGRVAIEKFKENPQHYKLILMDIHMPEMDGYEATRKIRLLPCPEAKSIPIMAMTANVFKEDVERCLAAGMNDHLGKPVDLEELIKRLKKYLLQ
jgi:PAS domain S-box-containing protein